VPEPEPQQQPPPLVRVQAYATAEEDTRIRNAWAAVSTPTNYPAIGHFVLAAVLEKVERLEQELNGGQPFPEPPGGIQRRRGRPPGSKDRPGARQKGSTD
jgi:hypothetical protein